MSFYNKIIKIYWIVIAIPMFSTQIFAPGANPSFGGSANSLFGTTSTAIAIPAGTIYKEPKSSTKAQLSKVESASEKFLETIAKSDYPFRCTAFAPQWGKFDEDHPWEVTDSVQSISGSSQKPCCCDFNQWKNKEGHNLGSKKAIPCKIGVLTAS